MNKFVKYGLILFTLGGAAYLLTTGKEKISQWANQITFKLLAFGKPTFYQGNLSLPVQVLVVNPAPFEIPITDFKINLFVNNRGTYTAIGGTPSTGKVNLKPGENQIILYPSVDIGKLNPLTNNSGTLVQNIFALVQNNSALLDIKADAYISIQGIQLPPQSVAQQFYFSDLLNALKTKSLGMVPNGKRSVTPVPANLKALVPLPTGKNEVIKYAGADPEYDTVPLIKKLVSRQKYQGAKLAQALKGKTVEETVRNNWQFFMDHIQYKPDARGAEEVRSLRRVVHGGVGDCDCFVNSLSNILKNQGIAHKYRITKYDGKPDYSHIYIVVPTGSGDYITLDPVVHQYNYEVPFTAKKDFSA
ncbi:MAG: hypothetical protein HOP30_19545 [Cyclobacteriaceae bacterium]|nr:hypothetical protein [Cyclobacteriaceae bacterium]